MIRKIRRISSYGAFDNWQWPAEVACLDATTIVYGANGSGKSTWAQLLADASAGTAPGSGLVLDVDSGDDQANASLRSVSAHDTDDPLWRRIRVFNRRYVEAHLSFDTDEVEAKALLTLGEQAVDAVATIKKNHERLIAIDKERHALTTAHKTAGRDRDQLAKLTAKSISSSCQAAGDTFGGRRYTAATVRNRLAGDVVSLVSNASRNEDADLATICEPPLETIRVPDWSCFDPEAAKSTLAQLLGQKIVNTVIEDLRADASLSHWVQAGRALHNGRTACAFCDGPLTASRLAELAEHFNHGLAALQQQLHDFDGSLERAAKSLDIAFAALPHPAALIVSVRGEYEAWRKDASLKIDEAREYIDALRRAVGSKLNQPFGALAVPALPECGVVDADRLQEILGTHYEHCENHGRKILEAAHRIEALRISEMANRYAKLDATCSAAQERLQLLEEQAKSIQAEIRSLERRDVDSGPLAAELTKDLAILLGRAELAFEPGPSQSQYLLTRNGLPAAGLSEGERTAVSLLYFLASLRQTAGAEALGEGQIVVVDDPVSSLDSSVMLGASSHLWRRLVDVEPVSQVIMLTHSFELLRTWMNLLGQRGRLQKRSAIVELRMRHRLGESDASPRRIPQLVGWPKEEHLRKRWRSEYHYLFWRVATTLEDCRASDVSRESELDAVAIAPNVARKMLEGFFSFRSPQRIGNLEKAIEDHLAQVNMPDGHRLMRFIHQHSHNEQVDLDRGIQVGEAVTVLESIFTLMRTVDADHVDAMHEALGLTG